MPESGIKQSGQMPPEEAGSEGQGEGARIARRAGTVAVFTLSSRVLGYVRDAVLANVFGAGVALDAFIAAQTIPYVLRRLVAEGSLMIAFVPLLSEAKTEGELPEMRRFTGAVLGLLIPFLLLLTGLGMAFPDAAVTLFASGFDPERARLASDLTRIMMPFLFFISLVAVAGGALNVVGIFGPPAAAPILLNVCIIGAAVLARSAFAVPIEAVGWGVSVGGLVQLLLQLPFLARRGMLVLPRWEPKHPKVSTLLRRMGPAVFGVGVYQLNMIIIRQIASFLPRGQLSCYFWASRLEEFALGVFAVSISIAALPTLSEHAARGDRAALYGTFRRAIRATNFITIPAMVGLFVMAEPIVGVLFRHGRFTAEDAALTSMLVRIMACALVPIGAVRVIVPTYYAVGDTKTPVAAATASLITTGLAGGLLGERFQIQGLTVATILAAAAQLVVLVLLLRRRIEAALADAEAGASGAPPPQQSMLLHGLKCLAAVAPPAVLAYFAAGLRPWFSGDNLIAGAYLLLIVGVVVGLYFVLARLFRIPEVDLILGAVRRRLGRSR